MRSIIFFSAILWAAALNAATNDVLNATNTTANTAAAFDAARALLNNAIAGLTNAPAAPAVEPEAKAAEKPAPAPGTNIVTTLPLSALNRDILDDKIRLRPGDLIRYRVQEDKDETKRLTVTDGGEVEVPYLGYVKAEGKTCKELAIDVKRLLEQDYYYLATVNIAIEAVLKKSLGRISVYGDGVSNPGQQEIPQDEVWTVSKAVMRAGPTDFANLKEVELFKGVGAMKSDRTNSAPVKPIIIHVDEILKKGKTEQDVVVEPFDQIVVKRLFLNFK